MIHSMRFVKVSGAMYLRVEDVASFIQEIASGEETDVRNRMKEAADNLVRSQQNQLPLPSDATKRARRREKREAEFGPERLITSHTPELINLECGHVIHNPPVQEKGPRTHFRCIQCKT